MMQKNKIKCSSNKRIPRGTTSTVNYTKNSNCTKKKVVLNSTWIAGTRPRNPPPITVCEGMTHASVTACESMPLYLTMRPCAAPDLRFILDDFSSLFFFVFLGPLLFRFDVKVRSMTGLIKPVFFYTFDDSIFKGKLGS